LRDGRVLWTVRLDEALADVFAMQDSITSQIVGALSGIDDTDLSMHVDSCLHS
jgi:TolB-like protein